MPVPSHLRECVHPLDDRLDESPLEGSLRCGCGATAFQFLYPGEVREWAGTNVPCVKEIDGRFFFLVVARCASCGKDHLLLDIDFHGWDGFVCHDPEQAAIPRPALVIWNCENCGGDTHRGTVRICGEGSEDFLREAANQFPAERWPDAFGWFSLDSECTRCGMRTQELFDCETM